MRVYLTEEHLGGEEKWRDAFRCSYLKRKIICITCNEQFVALKVIQLQHILLREITHDQRGRNGIICDDFCLLTKANTGRN